MKTKITHKWNVYLMALEKVVVTNSFITAPRIGICSNIIFITNDSWIDANYKGCEADKGFGNVLRTRDCAGSGGSHGGKAGRGGIPPPQGGTIK